MTSITKRQINKVIRLSYIEDSFNEQGIRKNEVKEIEGKLIRICDDTRYFEFEVEGRIAKLFKSDFTRVI